LPSSAATSTIGFGLVSFYSRKCAACAVNVPARARSKHGATTIWFVWKWRSLPSSSSTQARWFA